MNFNLLASLSSGFFSRFFCCRSASASLAFFRSFRIQLSLSLLLVFAVFVVIVIVVYAVDLSQDLCSPAAHLAHIM